MPDLMMRAELFSLVNLRLETILDVVRGWRPLIMPHAWTLSCELCFYAIAPWLVRWRTSLLVLVVVFAVAMINTLHWWVPTSRAELLLDYAFPFQIGFFVLGLLGYRLMRAKVAWVSGRSGLILSGALFLMVVLFQWFVSLSYRGGMTVIFVAACLGVPALFRLTSKWRWDRLLGELSYPVYLIHILVIRWMSCTPVRRHLGEPFYQSAWYSVTAMFLATLAAWLLVRFVDARINKVRQRRVAVAGV